MIHVFSTLFGSAVYHAKYSLYVQLWCFIMVSG